MAAFDSLPADQRAVLQLVLQRGQSYDDIAQLISIDRAAVRDRALAALDMLGPQTRAPLVLKRGRRPTVLTAILHGSAAFFRTYILKRGFLDGSYGFMLAVSNAEGSYYRYIKAMLLGQPRD